MPSADKKKKVLEQSQDKLHGRCMEHNVRNPVPAKTGKQCFDVHSMQLQKSNGAIQFSIPIEPSEGRNPRIPNAEKLMVKMCMYFHNSCLYDRGSSQRDHENIGNHIKGIFISFFRLVRRSFSFLIKQELARTLTENIGQRNQWFNHPHNKVE